MYGVTRPWRYQAYQRPILNAAACRMLVSIVIVGSMRQPYGEAHVRGIIGIILARHRGWLVQRTLYEQLGAF